MVRIQDDDIFCWHTGRRLVLVVNLAFLTVNFMVKPNLFLVGFPKARTTALAAILSKHPDIYSSHGDEVHYFEVKYKNLPYKGPGDMKHAPLKNKVEYLQLYDQRSEQYLRNNSITKIVLDTEIEQELKRDFRADVKKLENLISKDLSAWYG